MAELIFSMAPNKLDTILLIDDDDVANFIYSRIIANSAIANNIKTYQSAQAALNYLKECEEGNFSPPEIIFLDINMPVMSGWDFLEKYDSFSNLIKENTRIYMLSSSVYQEDLDKAKSYAEVEDYIIKPLTKEKLMEIRKSI